MKSFLIKLGKVYKMLRKNGILPVIRVLLVYIRTYLKNLFILRSGDILFITGGVGDSAHYRVHNQAEELRYHGFRCSTTLIDNPFLPKCAKKFKIFIFHRTIFTPKIVELVNHIKEQGKEIIFDTDDLVFDSSYFHHTDSYKSMNVLEKKQYQKSSGGEMITDPYIKVCTVSTSYLGKRVERLDKKVYISKNKLSDHELKVVEKILGTNVKIKYEKVKIGYFSGTLSHNKDFATITDALSELMLRFKNVEILLAGPLDVNNRLNKFKDRVRQLPFVPRNKYYENIHKVDINIYPLVSGDPFCESKSEIRFLETGILKVPTVAIKNQTYSETITDGVDGFLADGHREWVEKISRLIEDEDLRIRMGEKAREKVLRDHTNKNSHNEEYYNFLKSKLL